MEHPVAELTEGERAERAASLRRVLLPQPLVEERYHLSAMSLWRWVQDEALGFPMPLVIRNRNYFWLDELEAWERRMATESAGKRAQTPPAAGRGRKTA